MSPEAPSRDDLAAQYFESLPFDPYPVQEEALLAWFTAERGVLVCAPTGTGKTLIAEAALFEALKTGHRAYYTTPLIALTEQKLQEMQEAAQRWGFAADDVGLVTGNRQVNPSARILVVVAEILFNRLLHREAFAFDDVSAVVMDEFHSFNDPERGIVWELTLGLLPEHVRLLLLSATVGNALEFVTWLRKCHNRRLDLVQSDQRKVPLSYHWVGDALLTEHLEEMARGDEATRRTPALVFCFNREQCWTVAEQLKGKKVLGEGQQAKLVEALEQIDWSQGAGPKLRQILMRGVGVHHAGLLPKYKRIVEHLFQRKLLSVTVCTETLAAGINLPARSVVIPNLLKGPPDRKKLIEPSAAHQMFGRAGRPQFDSEGFIYALAHEDDVKILRWREKYDQIPEDTKDPGLRKAKKALKKKMPTRRANQQYWTESQFERLCAAPPAKLQSKGPLPWRLLAYMLDATPEVELIRKLVAKRLMSDKWLEAGQRDLDRMLMTLWSAGYVTLEPEPPRSVAAEETPPATPAAGAGILAHTTGQSPSAAGSETDRDEAPPAYRPQSAHPTPELAKLLLFRSVNPLYGVFLINQLGIADRAERIQAMESVLEMPRSLGRSVRVPGHDQLPPGPLATTRLDVQLLQLGLATPEELSEAESDQDDRDRMFREEKVWVLALADKLRRLFDHDFPGVHGLYTTSVWAAGELLEFDGDFNKYVTSKGLQKQEGIVFRHLLRLILLVGEFAQLSPADLPEDEWRGELHDIRDRLIRSCHQVDPSSTDKVLEEVAATESANSVGEIP
jgi:superfamily II DNA/RNA helicase